MSREKHGEQTPRVLNLRAARRECSPDRLANAVDVDVKLILRSVICGVDRKRHRSGRQCVTDHCFDQISVFPGSLPVVWRARDEQGGILYPRDSRSRDQKELTRTVSALQNSISAGLIDT